MINKNDVKLLGIGLTVTLSEKLTKEHDYNINIAKTA